MTTLWFLIVGSGLLVASFLLGRRSVKPGQEWLSGYLHARQLAFLRPLRLVRRR
jgi:hypothetical protein